MLKTILLPALALLAGPALAQVASPAAVELTVDVAGLRSDRGSCLVYVFKSSVGFPAEPRYAVAAGRGSIRSGKCQVCLPGLAPGEYAAAVVHDENGNGQLDTNLFGLPKEGLGTSNNPPAADGPPSFRQAKFALGRTALAVPVAVRYL